MTVMKEFVSLTMVTMKTGKKPFPAIIGLVSMRKNASSKHEPYRCYHWKTELIEKALEERKMSQRQKYKYREKRPESQEHYQFMTTFYNFALKIETSWVESVVKSVSETRNASDVTLYVCFIHSGVKILKTYKVKKNNPKCAKFTIEN